MSHSNSGLEQFGGVFGTLVSASFLFLIALMNLVVLAGIIRVFRSMRDGTYDEAELEAQLQNRGLMYRFFGKWMRSIDKEWKLYPVGVVFGMGFDTATEVVVARASTALLGGPARAVVLDHVPADPLHRGHGPHGHDRLLFMNVAYGWAFFNPVRKIFYNLAITGSFGGDLLLHRRRSRSWVSCPMNSTGRARSGDSCRASTSTRPA